MKATKYEIVNSLLKEAMTPEQEHDAIQKKREKDWATRGKAAGALAGLGSGMASVLKKNVQNKTMPGYGRLAGAAIVGTGAGIIGGYLGKKIATLVARMSKEGYSKPEIDQAVGNLKRKTRG